MVTVAVGFEVRAVDDEAGLVVAAFGRDAGTAADVYKRQLQGLQEVDGFHTGPVSRAEQPGEPLSNSAFVISAHSD